MIGRRVLFTGAKNESIIGFVLDKVLVPYSEYVNEDRYVIEEEKKGTIYIVSPLSIKKIMQHEPLSPA